jgi:hypothetical protein
MPISNFPLRPYQANILHKIIPGSRTFVQLPTGGGKTRRRNGFGPFEFDEIITGYVKEG